MKRLSLLAAVFLLASCGSRVDWSKSGVIALMKDPAGLRSEPSNRPSKWLAPIPALSQVDLRGKTVTNADGRFTLVRFGSNEGWVNESLVQVGRTAGVMRSKAAWRPSPEGSPAGMLAVEQIVLVKMPRTEVEAGRTAFLDVLFFDGGAWKSGFVAAENASVESADVRIFTVARPALETYLQKAEANPDDAEARKQIELAIAYIAELPPELQKSEFYPSLLAMKSELELRLGNPSGKILEHDTNNEYEVKR